MKKEMTRVTNWHFEHQGFKPIPIKFTANLRQDCSGSDSVGSEVFKLVSLFLSVQPNVCPQLAHAGVLSQLASDGDERLDKSDLRRIRLMTSEAEGQDNII